MRARTPRPDRVVLARCYALGGVHLPADSTGAEQALAFLSRLQRLLEQKQLKRPICEAFGEAMLEQQLALGGVRPPAQTDSAERRAGTVRGQPPLPSTTASARQLDDMQRLYKLQLTISSWASSRVGGRLRKSLQKSSFESWAAPLATALACSASHLRVVILGQGRSMPHSMVADEQKAPCHCTGLPVTTDRSCGHHTRRSSITCTAHPILRLSCIAAFPVPTAPLPSFSIFARSMPPLQRRFCCLAIAAAV